MTLKIFILFVGEWVIILVTAIKQWTGNYNETQDSNLTLSEMFSSQNLKMENFSQFWIGSVLVSYVMYFTVGGFLHVKFNFLQYNMIVMT